MQYMTKSLQQTLRVQLALKEKSGASSLAPFTPSSKLLHVSAALCLTTSSVSLHIFDALPTFISSLPLRSRTQESSLLLYHIPKGLLQQPESDKGFREVFQTGSSTTQLPN
ncbi:hypothetical protein E2C01_064714 [Portunus trituberculatus]|uniref:Uncharacterized protein n=1 Tax=Portunus trituberculatus TaxID=210409 RepID=A0A5B7HLK3_PORTR|nr:hypothetical protein [Portunus trituberculatus]